MRNKLRLLTVCIMLLFFSTQLYSFNEMDRQIGIIYLKNAAAFYLNGNYARSLDYLDKTEEFYINSSDHQYLSGLIKFERDNNLNEAADYFRKAIENRNWILLDKKECVTDLSQILFRTKRYDQLINLVENESYPDYDDNDLMFLYLLSLRNEGRTALYRTLLAGSIVRYPDDYRFGKLYVHENAGYRNDLLNGRVVYGSSEGYMDVFFEAVMTLEDPLRIRAFEKYFASGGKNASALLEYYRLRGDITDTELDALISGDFFRDPARRMRLLEILPENEQRRKVEEAYASYTGSIYFDLNSDGYFEELHLYEFGVPAGMSIDANQDGEIEVMLIFEDGLPSELILSAEQLINISWGTYPFIEEVGIADGTVRKIYTLLKDRVELDVYSIREYDDKLVYLAGNVDALLSDRGNLSSNSVRLSEYTGGADKANYDYLRSELERRDEMNSILKIYDEILGNYVYRQFDDRKIEGFGDLDYDNLIDLREVYSDGKIVSIEADDNKNGRYDYKLVFEEEYVVSMWDFNEDGIYDCRQYQKNGILISEYSSRLDGNFDIIERN